MVRLVSWLASIDTDKCNGCRTCERVCPVLAVRVVDKRAVVDGKTCLGCAACEQRCPQAAVMLVKRKEPFTVQTDVSKVPYEKVEALCKKAKFHPEQLICYCTATRAEEVAAAILLGAKTAEDVSAATGIRTGCKVECIQPILRLLEAADINPVPPEGGWQWYGRTKTVWDIPKEVKEKYSKRGFYFDDDIRLLDKVVEAKPSRRRD